jgi:hypothetical protein
VKDVTDLLDVIVSILQQGFRLGDHVLLDDQKRLLSGDLADDA